MILAPGAFPESTSPSPAVVLHCVSSEHSPPVKCSLIWCVMVETGLGKHVCTTVRCQVAWPIYPYYLPVTGHQPGPVLINQKIILGQIQNDHLSKTSWKRIVADQLPQVLINFSQQVRQKQSTETALLRVTIDLLIHSDRGEHSILVLLEVSSAFHTTGHIPSSTDLLQMQAKVLEFFSYLSNRRSFVSMVIFCHHLLHSHMRCLRGLSSVPFCFPCICFPWARLYLKFNVYPIILMQMTHSYIFQ